MADVFESMDEEELDELVHDVMAGLAAGVNNQGRQAQLKFLREADDPQYEKLFKGHNGHLLLVQRSGYQLYCEACRRVIWQHISVYQESIEFRINQAIEEEETA
jgi:hypothetical protein